MIKAFVYGITGVEYIDQQLKHGINVVRLVTFNGESITGYLVTLVPHSNQEHRRILRELIQKRRSHILNFALELYNNVSEDFWAH